MFDCDKLSDCCHGQAIATSLETLLSGVRCYVNTLALSLSKSNKKDADKILNYSNDFRTFILIFKIIVIKIKFRIFSRYF